MTHIPLLTDIVVIFGVAIGVLFICHRIRIPPIVGYLLTGVLIGPYGLGFVQSVHDVEALAEIGIILLLFTIGIEFSFRDLLGVKRAVLLGGALQVGLTIVGTFLAVRYFGQNSMEALFMGFLIALSSTAIVLRSLQERAEIFSPHGRVILSILIFQDIIIIPMMIFTPLLADFGGDVGSSLIGLLLKGIGVIVAVVICARYIVPNVLFQVTRTRSRELFLLSIVVICMAVAWGTNALGLSLGLGAFLAGLIISDSEYSHQALEGILPFKDVFNSFFFVSIGMLLDTSFVLSEPLTIVGASIVVYLGKAVLATAAALLLGLSGRAALLVGLGLGQVGEFSFILSRVGMDFNLLTGSNYQLFIALSIFTMAATPFVTVAAPKLATIMADWPLIRRFKAGSYRSLAQNGEGHLSTLSDHLIIIGFGVNGKNIAHAARTAQIPYVIIEMNPDTVKQCREQGEPISYGDATSLAVLEQARLSEARIVVVAISDPAATRRITNSIRRYNGGVYIIVRTRFVAEVEPLVKLGANEVIPEEFETSVEIFTRVLSRYLVPRDEIERFTSEIRSHSYEMLRSLSQRTATVGDLELNIPNLRIQSLRVPEKSPVIGKSLAELNIRARCGVTLLAIVHNSEVRSNPTGSDRLAEKDVMFVLGDSERTARLDALLKGKDVDAA
ncbi:potassium transporter KefB [candidate division GN15 bacterium]|nr:potassium transporter KefB [candidate division GN15 bacterium]